MKPVSCPAGAPRCHPCAEAEALRIGARVPGSHAAKAALKGEGAGGCGLNRTGRSPEGPWKRHLI